MFLSCKKISDSQGFTLIELVLVVVILGVLAAFALPRFSDLSTDARLAALDSLEGTMKSTIGIVRSKAYAQGLSPAASNPGGIQTNYVIETEAGRSEVDWRNLCPESRAEADDTLTMLDYISVDANDSSLQTFVDSNCVGDSFLMHRRNVLLSRMPLPLVGSLIEILYYLRPVEH